MICLLSANPHHNALRGGAASAVLIQGGRALLGCQISFAGLGWLLGGADQLLLIEAPPNFVCPRTGGGVLWHEKSARSSDAAVAPGWCECTPAVTWKPRNERIKTRTS